MKVGILIKKLKRQISFLKLQNKKAYQLIETMANNYIENLKKYDQDLSLCYKKIHSANEDAKLYLSWANKHQAELIELHEKHTDLTTKYYELKSKTPATDQSNEGKNLISLEPINSANL